MTEQRYPAVTRSEMERLVAVLLQGEFPDVSNSITWNHVAYSIDLVPIYDACHVVLSHEALTSETTTDKDAVEAWASTHLYPALKQLPIQVLDDEGFWRYLSLHLWEFVRWRENITEKNIRIYLDGTRNSECVPLRMFLRSKAVDIDGDISLATAVTSGTDFWRSHIIRVRAGYYPAVIRPYVRMQSEQRLKTEALRSFARQVNRVSSNLVLASYGETDGEALIKELRLELDTSSDPVAGDQSD